MPEHLAQLFVRMFVTGLQGRSKAELLADHFSPVPGIWERTPLAPKIADIASDSFKSKLPPEIRGTGDVADALEAAQATGEEILDIRNGSDG